MAKKNYAFYYADKDTIYMQVGFVSFEDARRGLGQIAGIFTKELARGRVDKIENGEIRTENEYDIFTEDKRVCFKVRK